VPEGIRDFFVAGKLVQAPLFDRSAFQTHSTDWLGSLRPRRSTARQRSTSHQFNSAWVCAAARKSSCT
jgi:hypothetical protein